MAKGYWIARIDVTDPEGYQEYVAANAAAAAQAAAAQAAAAYFKTTHEESTR